jgi:hypothetical protein
VLRRDWNALRPGDRVLVHHSVDGSVRLVAGVVATVAACDGSNAIAVRVDASGGHQTIEPRRLRVHHDPIEADAHCWSCASSTPAEKLPRPRGS